VVIWLLRYGRPLRAVGIAVAIAAALFGLELVLFRFADRLFDSTFPALTLFGALGLMLVFNLRAAQGELLAPKLKGRSRSTPHRADQRPSPGGPLN
jgi:hypothetical protein